MPLASAIMVSSRPYALQYLLLMAVSISAPVDSTGATFQDQLKRRDISQSPHGSAASAAEYNYALDRDSFLAFYGGANTSLALAALAEEASIESIKKRCGRDEATKSSCEQEFGGDPLAVIAFQQALATDDAISKESKFYSGIGIGEVQRQQYLETTYKAFKNSKFVDERNSLRTQVRERVKVLAGKNAENALKALDESAATNSESTVQKATITIGTDLDKARELTDSPFFPSELKADTKSLINKVEKADAVVKAGIRDLAVTNLQFFTNAETALGFSLKAAKLFGASKGDQENIARAFDVAQKGTKAFNSLLTLGRAAAGDITAYANAAGAIMSLFGGGGPSPESQIMAGISQILENQKKMLQRLDFIIAQLDTVMHQLADLEKQVVVIDKNVRLLIEGQRQLLAGNFLACVDHADTILTTENVMKATSQKHFDLYTFPYDPSVYQVIVNEGVALRDKQKFVAACESGIPAVFTGFDQGPNPLFLLEAPAGGPSPDKLFEKDTYFHRLTEFTSIFRSTFKDDALSKIGDVEFRILASIPATTFQGLDTKVGGSKTKTYLFGARTGDKIASQLGRSFDPYRVAAMGNWLYETLPYVWLHHDKQKNCRSNSCEGLTNWISESYVKYLLNSLHLNLFVSSSESMLEGDIVLTMIHKVLVGEAALKADPIYQELRTRAYELLSFNVLLRENYLRYLIHQSYVGVPRSAYRLDYEYINDLRSFERTVGRGNGWTFIKKIVDSKPPAKEPAEDAKVLHVEMPCIEKLGSKQLSKCTYPLPSPDIFILGEFVHSASSKELARVRSQGNRLLSVIEMYHPKNKRIAGSGL
jgi:hypothetical protein